MSISGGSVAGIYFHIAEQLCGYLNEAAGQKRCESRSGFGSAFNINALENNLLEFALAQSDLQWNAWQGVQEWDEIPATNLRTIAVLHTEAVHLVATNASGIETVSGLKGHKVSVGNRSSGQRKNALTVLDLYGLDYQTDLQAYGLLQGNVLKQVGAGELDAFFYTVGYPSKSIRRLAGLVPLRFLNLTDTDVLDFVSNNPAYQPIRIPAKTYPGQGDNILTFGTRSALLTSSAVSDELVLELLGSLYDHFDELTASHPGLGRLDINDLARNATVPLHPAAEAFYREKGLLD